MNGHTKSESNISYEIQLFARNNSLATTMFYLIALAAQGGRIQKCPGSGCDKLKKTCLL